MKHRYVTLIRPQRMTSDLLKPILRKNLLTMTRQAFPRHMFELSIITAQRLTNT